MKNFVEKNEKTGDMRQISEKDFQFLKDGIEVGKWNLAK